MITHIFSDLDGTLLNETGNITEKNAATIIESGIPFSFPHLFSLVEFCLIRIILSPPLIKSYCLLILIIHSSLLG